MWLLSYFWDSEIHLEIFSLSFESAAAGVELLLAIWLAKTVIAFEKEPIEKIKRRREKLEAAFGVVAALFLAVAVGSIWRLVVLHESNVIKAAEPLISLSNRLEQTETKFAAATNELENALKAAKIKPLKDRIADCINSIDKRVMPVLRAGHPIHFTAEVLPYQYLQLQTLANEPGSEKYIIFRRDPWVLSANPSIGQINNLDVDLMPAIAEP